MPSYGTKTNLNLSRKGRLGIHEQWAHNADVLEQTLRYVWLRKKLDQSQTSSKVEVRDMHLEVRRELRTFQRSYLGIASAKAHPKKYLNWLATRWARVRHQQNSYAHCDANDDITDVCLSIWVLKSCNRWGYSILILSSHVRLCPKAARSVIDPRRIRISSMKKQYWQTVYNTITQEKKNWMTLHTVLISVRMYKTGGGESDTRWRWKENLIFRLTGLDGSPPKRDRSS